MKQLGKFKDTIGNITAIPLNTEKLKILQFGNITLMDSAAFIPHSLEKMTETLKNRSIAFPFYNNGIKLRVKWICCCERECTPTSM